MVLENICALCNLPMENTWHLMFDCTHARSTWNELNLWSTIEPFYNQAEGFQEISFELLSNFSKEHKSTLAVGLWGLWKCRNNKVWEGNRMAPKQVAIMSLDLLHSWKWARDSGN